MLRLIALVLIVAFAGDNSLAKLHIMTTTANLKSLVSEIAGDRAEVESFCLGPQDPHFLEAKPSYTLKASKADLLVSVGMDLEVGWLPLIIRGARNPKIREGQSGHLVLGHYVDAIEKPHGEVSRADGDVHPEGNPHFMLSPKRVVKLAEVVSAKLTEIDPEGKEFFESNKIKFLKKIEPFVQKKISKIEVVTHHKTLNYFLHDYGLDNSIYLEPKPGIPPSATHVLSVIEQAKVKKANIVLVENYFDQSAGQKVAKALDIKSYSVPVAVGGKEGISNLFDLYSDLFSYFK
ncbi:periplasmic solute-binding family protein [Bacteriovorax sp. BSW11_IV]|uniref:metal ABC transporter substrate-binding protein n=1 Tax=Bacteriovorax sp. BSW11_IV TaxID=1353529 RepID=UPI00038A130F|nr:metal ABC transporter substrate-binding protein [Bacteriovorax sp. BSW11_IV]EQC43028.1 periplasmic solute-binding family protein [Bacteriovorax sp. BSW11_IV]